jgi:Acetyltransferases, including N-acetylases of ribosomal proteins
VRVAGDPLLTLRSRRDADLAVIVGWVPDARALYLFAGPRLRWPLTESQLRELGESEGMTSWVLVETDSPAEPIGHVDLTFVSGAEARLGRVIVDPARRGEGLGATLARGALDAAWDLGATRVRLNVIAGNIPAIRVYEGLGFVPDGASERADVVSMIAVRRGCRPE